MPLAFPLTAAQFWQTLLISEITFDAPEQVVMSQTGGGEQLTAEVAPMLWTGQVTLGVMTAAEAASAEILLDVLRPPGRHFYAFDTRRPFPAADPAGAILGASTPTIQTLVAGDRELRLQGLPNGYQLRRGDYLAWTYGSGRRALHRVVDATVVTAVGGVTPVFEVTPMIRPGVVAGAAVSLVRPDCKARLVPGSVSKGTSRRTITDGMTFRFIQTLG